MYLIKLLYSICGIYFNLRYDPYERKITREYYNHDEMKKTRQKAIEMAKHGKTFGLILGTLGRQGSTKVLNYFHVCLFYFMFTTLCIN